jgi:hypothetical protein
MRRDLADPGRGLAAQGLADPDRDLDLDLARDLADLGRGMAARDLADRELGRTDRVDRGDLVERGLADRELGRTDRVDRGDLVERGLAARDLVDRDLVDRGRADRDLADRADRDKGRNRADRDRDLGRGVADRCRGALTIGVMPRWVAPRMRLAASAHATTARHLRRKREDSAGTMGLLPVGRRVTGSARHLQAVGTVLRLPVVGTTRGTGRSAA